MAQYVVGLDSSGIRLGVWKTTGDPTTLTNWSAQDRLATLRYEPKSIWAVLDGTDIHIVTMTLIGPEFGSTSGHVEYHKFSTSSDTWTILREEAVKTPGADGLLDAHVGCSIGVRSDGDIIVLYGDFVGGNGSDVFYARRESGTWTTDFQVNSAAVAEHRAGVIVMGASDRAHFFYYSDLNDDIYHRSLSSANSLDTEATVDAAVGASVLHPIGRGIAYPDNGNTTIKVPYLDADESITSIRIDASGANPTIATDTAASDNDAEDINSSVVACMAVDGTDTWLLYSGGGVSGVDQDLYTDMQSDGGSWGTDTEEQDAITMNRLSAGKYTRSATDYIGYVWLDGTTTSYDEITLAASYDEITLAAPPAPIPDRLYAVEQAINRSSTY
jgi:hypothetical protein